MLNVTVSFCVSLYSSFVYVTVQFSCYLIIIDNCQSSTFLTGVKTPYTIYIVDIILGFIWLYFMTSEEHNFKSFKLRFDFPFLFWSPIIKCSVHRMEYSLVLALFESRIQTFTLKGVQS